VEITKKILRIFQSLCLCAKEFWLFVISWLKTYNTKIGKLGEIEILCGAVSPILSQKIIC
jgi:hypothetical protein